jgi:hypothetical protein
LWTLAMSRLKNKYLNDINMFKKNYNLDYRLD